MFGINGKLGFGCMRLPMTGDEVDFEQTSRMFDLFLEKGFNYFDTAHGYLNGKSEIAVRKCLTDRYPRDRYLLADKLTDAFFNSPEDIVKCFNEQLAICGVEYFDFYLMHCQSRRNYEKFRKNGAYEIAADLKRRGFIRHLGFSFHDNAEFLEVILKDHPEVDFVQLQFNYFDYSDAAVGAGDCYRICEKYGKPVMVMEPVRGGQLANLNPEADAIFKSLNGGSNASYAIRFAAGFENVAIVLSGMSNIEMTEDNISYMADFRPLTETEMDAVGRVCNALRKGDTINCTACHYCTSFCPNEIKIPELFGCYNLAHTFDGWLAKYYYKVIHTKEGSKASDCLECGSCEEQCPQHLEIRSLLKKVAAEFESEKKE